MLNLKSRRFLWDLEVLVFRIISTGKYGWKYFLQKFEVMPDDLSGKMMVYVPFQVQNVIHLVSLASRHYNITL